jgi:hypothetical protein
VSTNPHDPHNPDAWRMTFPSTMQQSGAEKPFDVICEWLRALGLDTSRLPADPHASMADGQLTLLRKVRGPNGGDVLNSDRTGVMTETITVPVTVAPPPIAEIWLAPKCPTCGR